MMVPMTSLELALSYLKDRFPIPFRRHRQNWGTRQDSNLRKAEVEAPCLYALGHGCMVEAVGLEPTLRFRAD